VANEERDQVRVSRRSGGRDDAELRISDAVNPILLAYESRADANFGAVVVSYSTLGSMFTRGCLVAALRPGESLRRPGRWL
jgi:hypothetical protein